MSESYALFFSIVMCFLAFFVLGMLFATITEKEKIFTHNNYRIYIKTVGDYKIVKIFDLKGNLVEEKLIPKNETYYVVSGGGSVGGKGS